MVEIQIKRIAVLYLAKREEKSKNKKNKINNK